MECFLAENHKFLKEQLLGNIENPLLTSLQGKKKKTKYVENKNHKNDVRINL